MIEYVKTTLTGQFEASLCMLNGCVKACPQEHWEGKIAKATFRQVAYHTLFYVDVYLSTDEAAFSLRDLHQRGGDERRPVISIGLNKDETLKYLKICRQKMLDTLAAETAESLQGRSGFSRVPISRGKLHVYNLRHVQHHTGQLSAYLRKKRIAAPWVKTGWQ